MNYYAPCGAQYGIDIWPARWVDATGYGVLYRIGTPAEAFHTGADLNCNAPRFDFDAHTKVWSVGLGTVTYAGWLEGWGNVIVVRYRQLDGRLFYARYAHVENMQVEAWGGVKPGQHIANVGNAGGLFPYHLHFDISTTGILEEKPGHWPRRNLPLLLQHYVDPKRFLRALITPPRRGVPMLVVATDGLNVRAEGVRSAQRIGVLRYRERVEIDPTSSGAYVQLLDRDGWVAREWLAPV